MVVESLMKIDYGITNGLKKIWEKFRFKNKYVILFLYLTRRAYFIKTPLFAEQADDWDDCW